MRTVVGLGFLALFAGLLIAGPVIHFTTMEQTSFEVEGRERILDSDGTSRYMVWALMNDDRVEVMENTDSILSLKFNSADLYGEMQIGAVCEATVNGFRVPFLSMNRNIIEVACQ